MMDVKNWCVVQKQSNFFAVKLELCLAQNPQWFFYPFIRNFILIVQLINLSHGPVAHFLPNN